LHAVHDLPAGALDFPDCNFDHGAARDFPNPVSRDFAAAQAMRSAGSFKVFFVFRRPVAADRDRPLRLGDWSMLI
jgi:hypothetical protein